jgi:hypothetical protein
MNAILDPYSEEHHMSLEGLYPTTYEGFEVGNKVRFTRDVADDVTTGNVGIITEIDNHPEFPFTVTVLKLAGQNIENLPVSPAEIELDR